MSFKETAAIVGGKLFLPPNPQPGFSGVSIDSRAITPGQLFIAIHGESDDGHKYIRQAVEKGASGVIAEYTHPEIDAISRLTTVIAVENSHEAMIRLATNYRHTLKATFIGITGSNGKTTTKEFTYRLIGAVEEKCFYSPGNLNNLFGVPLSLFAIPNDARVVILEMGISTTNEMPRLAELVVPDCIILTNVGPSHLEFLDTVQAVAQAKLELVRKADSRVPVIVNADDPVLVTETAKLRKNFVTFGIDNEAAYRPERIEMEESGASRVTIENMLFRIPLVGRHQVYNLLAAYAACRTLGYSLKGVDTMNIRLDTAPMRGQRIDKAGISIIADCYNANPESVRAGLNAFFALPAIGRRIVILGDMLELGSGSEKYHREIGRQLAEGNPDLAILIGPMSKYVCDEAAASGMSRDTLHHFDNSERAAEYLSDFFKESDIVYIKGSRGIKLERVLDSIGTNGGHH